MEWGGGRTSGGDGWLLVGLIVEDGSGAEFVARDASAADGKTLTGLQVGVVEVDVRVELLLKNGVFGLEASLFILGPPVQGRELVGGVGDEGGLLEVLGLLEESFEEDVAFMEGGPEGFGFFLCLYSTLLGFQTVKVLDLQEEGFENGVAFGYGGTEGFGWAQRSFVPGRSAPLSFQMVEVSAQQGDGFEIGVAFVSGGTEGFRLASDWHRAASCLANLLLLGSRRSRCCFLVRSRTSLAR